jgi:hypothetical protein
VAAQDLRERHAPSFQQRFATCFGQRHHRADTLARHPFKRHNRRLRHIRMLREASFKFGQRHALAIEFDHAIKASLQTKAPVAVERDGVVGAMPVVVAQMR